MQPRRPTENPIKFKHGVVWQIQKEIIFLKACTRKRNYTLTSRAPPWTFLMPIIFRDSSSSRDMTASTTILAKKSFWLAISLEFKAVAAHFSSSCLCSLKWKETKSIQNYFPRRTTFIGSKHGIHVTYEVHQNTQSEIATKWTNSWLHLYSLTVHHLSSQKQRSP